MEDYEDVEIPISSLSEDDNGPPETSSLCDQAACNDPGENNTQSILPSNPAPVNYCGEVDLWQAGRFLEILAGNEPVTFQTFADRKDIQSPPSLARILQGTLERHAQELMRLNSMGAGIFVMVNKGDGRGRRAENVIGVRAPFVDLDGAPLKPVLEAPLRPDMIVETSPGRYQVYWKVNGIKLCEFSFFQQELAHRFGGDPKVKDLPRVMRIPGFFHLKGDPFLVRIIEPTLEVPHV